MNQILRLLSQYLKKNQNYLLSNYIFNTITSKDAIFF